MGEDKRLNEVIRVQKRASSFVMMDKGFIEDESLSWKAKGILAYLLSKPDNWKVIVGDVVKHATDGKTAVYNGLAELSGHGYYEKMPVRSKSGQRIDHWESTVYELPKATNPGNTPSALLPGFQEIDNQEIDNLFIENRERNNNYLSNNDFTKNHVSQVMSASPDGQDTNGTDGEVQTVNDYIGLIKDNIRYPDLIDARPYDAELIDEFVNIILDALMSEGGYVRIDGEKKSRPLFKHQLMRLTYDDIDHALDQFKGVSERITKKKQYIQTLLYNCKLERDSHYTNAYKSDFYGGC